MVIKLNRAKGVSSSVKLSRLLSYTEDTIRVHQKEKGKKNLGFTYLKVSSMTWLTYLTINQIIYAFNLRYEKYLRATEDVFISVSWCTPRRIFIQVI